MKSRWYANWLIIITMCLFLSSLGLFVISIKDSIGFTKCAYGDDLEGNCICNADGEKICDEGIKEDEALIADEFTSSSLTYSYDFVDYIDAGNRVTSSVKFSDISYLGGGLKISLELRSLCNSEGISAPQIGLYKLDEERLTLSVASNINSESFSTPCVTQSSFYIGNFPLDLNDDFKVVYQDEFSVIYPSNNCIYEGFVRNDGDVYNSKDGCSLCYCKLGISQCEVEPSCL